MYFISYYSGIYVRQGNICIKNIFTPTMSKTGPDRKMKSICTVNVEPRK